MLSQPFSFLFCIFISSYYGMKLYYVGTSSTATSVILIRGSRIDVSHGIFHATREIYAESFII